MKERFRAEKLVAKAKKAEQKNGEGNDNSQSIRGGCGEGQS